MINVCSLEECEAVTAEYVGSKAANLYRIAEQGIAVPEAVVIPCSYSLETKDKQEALLEKVIEAVVGSPTSGLWSVRSGSPKSMPGMMDTILNVGLTAELCRTYAESFSESVALKMFGELILTYANMARVDTGKHFIRRAKSWEDIEYNLSVYENQVGTPYPNTQTQLRRAIKAVWQSYFSDRAKYYRKLHSYPEDMGTGVIIQRMVFGNKDDRSCSGVVFSRSPVDGGVGLYGEYVVQGQGEALVSGGVTPKPIQDLQYDWPQMYYQLEEVARGLEMLFEDMQDIEFTVESGQLYVLQSRRGARSNRACIQVIADLKASEVISESTAYKRLATADFSNLSASELIDTTDAMVYGIGIPGGGGVVKGKIVTSVEGAINCTEPCILCLPSTDVTSIEGIANAAGVLTTVGGVTSHAAVVARAMGKTSVVGLEGMTVLPDGIDFRCKINRCLVGDDLVIDGSTGKVYYGEVVLSEGGTEWFRHCLDSLLAPTEYLRVFEASDVSGKAVNIVMRLSDFGLDADRLIDVLRACRQGTKVYIYMDLVFDGVSCLVCGQGNPNASMYIAVTQAIDCEVMMNLDVVWVPNTDSWLIPDFKILAGNMLEMPPWDEAKHYSDIFGG